MIRVLLELSSDAERVRLIGLLASDPELRVVDNAESADVLITEESDRSREDPPLLVLLDVADHFHVAQALRAGARGAIPRRVDGPQLAAAVRAVHHGWLVNPPEPAAVAAVEPLTARELEVLSMLADGLSNKEIASKLGISDHTVKFHVNSILGKLGAGSRTEAVTIGLRSGLILL
ncbi:MAG TPA: response regulator transcription factor [Bryobacteraceae bacterium]|nr:response regulator transcription factor [Bryobacteraceae bacterium]